ncbi:MAG TPA: hypothetical protein VK922_10585 [Gemmatimonadaceae bacterium]|nr:hypothetical protein [Gemmatimonadaceae bacterium]
MSTIAGGVRARHRSGTALIVAVVALAVIGLLVAAAHLAAVESGRAGERRFMQAEAFAAAEYGVERAAANAPLAAWRAMPPGSTDWSGPWSVGRATVSVRVTRLGDSITPLVLIEGVGGAGSAPTRRARRTVSLTMSLAEGRFAPLGALTIGGGVTVGAGAMVDGNDLPPAGWSCPVPGPALPGIATPDAATVTVSCGPACLGGAPPVAQLAVAGASSTYLVFGDIGWAELVAAARPVSSVANPAPSSSAGACLTSDLDNWGDPARGSPPAPCESFFPVLHAPGDLHLAGGVGQGVLLVDGDLTVSGGARFAGIVIVRGAVHAAGTGGRIEGALMAAALSGAASDIAGSLVIAHSRCALAEAERATLRPVPIPFRGWSEVY